MAYVKTNWKTGDTITADKLNNIENGIASSGGDGGALITEPTCTENPDGYTIDFNITFNEIKNAYLSSKNIIASYPSETENLYGNFQVLTIWEATEDGTTSYGLKYNVEDIGSTITGEEFVTTDPDSNIIYVNSGH